jgi:AraC-like DNA-binding protein
MTNLTKYFKDANNIDALNARLRSSVAHCLSLKAGGWHFRVSHITVGTYKKGHSINWHSHPYYQLEIPITRNFIFRGADEQTLPLKPSQAILIPWKYAHKWKCLEGGIMLGVSLDLLPTSVSIKQDGWLIKQIEVITNSSIEKYAISLVTSSTKRGHTELQAKAIACHLFLLLNSILKDTLPISKKGNDHDKLAADTRGQETVSRVIQYLMVNLKNELNLTEVAREVNLSPRHLHRLFLKHAGKSMHDYLIEQRLNEARKMLLNKGHHLLIKEIAYETGFRSVACFSNCFKKKYGIPPSGMLKNKIHFKECKQSHVHDHPNEATAPLTSKPDTSPPSPPLSHQPKRELPPHTRHGHIHEQDQGAPPYQIPTEPRNPSVSPGSRGNTAPNQTDVPLHHHNASRKHSS